MVVSLEFLVNKDMDEINEYLKNKLPNNFMFDDDFVMQKLESCIETLKRSKLGQLESVPIKELASQPFGTFKATNKQEMLSQMADKGGLNGEKSSNENRLAALEKMASVRLEVEKKKQREERKRRKQERLAAAAATAAADGASFGAAFINDGKPIKNISDEDEEDGESEDDEDEDDDDDEDEEDDLNPSKLSEYEDERGEKASILSDLTHQTRSSSEMTSQNSLDNRKNNKARGVSSLKQARSSAERGASRARDDDDLMRIPRNDNDYSGVNLNHMSAHNSPVKFVPKGTREPSTAGHESADRKTKTSSVLIASNSNGVLNSTEAQDGGGARFSKVTAKPLGQMRESPNAVNINRTTSMAFTSPTARVMSNPPPISPAHNGHINSLNSSSNVSSNSIFTNGYEYVRSPHGIYTRVNQLTRQSSSLNANKLIQHSASNIQIAAVQASTNSTSNTTAATPIPISTKRTSSLRNVQPPQRVQHHPERTTTPTKQQLHNHSLRIASIQQQQQVAVNGQPQQQQQVTYPAASISIISQAPKTTFQLVTATTDHSTSTASNHYNLAQTAK